MRRIILEHDPEKLHELPVGVLGVAYNTYQRLVGAKILDVETLTRYAPSGLRAVGLGGPIRIDEIQEALTAFELTLAENNRQVRLVDEVNRRINTKMAELFYPMEVLIKVFRLNTLADLIEMDMLKLTTRSQTVNLKKILKISGTLFESYDVPRDTPNLKGHQSLWLLDIDKSIKDNLNIAGFKSIDDVDRASDASLKQAGRVGPIKAQEIRRNIAKKLR